MTKYVIKRILLMFLTLFVIMTMCFVLIKLLPLPAIREMGRDINLVLAKREAMGYDKPIMVQYYLFMKNVLLHWDWGVGEQMYEALSVWNVLMQKLPYTVIVNLYSILLAIPGVIFSESMLSYLHIINLETSSMTSIGTMLSNGQGYLGSFPHIILFPALFISILEISFNLFGNGLRDAFNPSLRGADE